MPNCPLCGAAMRLYYSVTDDRREWQCSRAYAHEAPCRGTLAILSDDILPINEMALAMLQQPFATANERRKDQSNWRRLSGALRTTLQTPYLSTPERAALRQAIEVLGRLGDAAERAKRTKITAEEQTRQRDAERRRLAMAQLARLRCPDLVDMAINALGLHQINDQHQPWDTGWTRRFENVGALRRSVQWHFDDGLRSAADRIAWNWDVAPVADLVERVAVRLNTLRADLTGDPCIVELRNYLAVEQAGNVIRLGPPNR